MSIIFLWTELRIPKSLTMAGATDPTYGELNPNYKRRAGQAGSTEYELTDACDTVAYVIKGYYPEDCDSPWPARRCLCDFPVTLI
jgi:hypothetical protein